VHADDLVVVHDPRDPLLVDDEPGGLKLGGDAWGAVGPVGLGVDELDLVGQEGVGVSALLTRLTAAQPLVEAGADDVEDLAQPLDLVGLAVVGDELETA
jgi:hypothetical protein